MKTGESQPSLDRTVTSDEAAPPRAGHDSGSFTPDILATTRSGLAWMTDSRDGMPEEDVTEYRIRIRKIITISMLLWPSFIVVDILMTSIYSDVPLWVLAWLRLIGWLPIGTSALILHKRWLSEYHHIKRLEAVTYVWATAAIGLMCLELGGPSSPYAVGFLLVLMTRGLFLSERWQVSLQWNIAIGSIYAIILLLSAAVSERTAAQFNAEGWAYFAMYNIFIGTAIILMAVGSDSIWALRRQLYEARALGRYRLLHRLGSGGMGEVWRAHHPGLRRDVAVKIARVDRANDPVYRERFWREISATTELNHPNCVRIFDCGSTEDGLVYYVMELLEGETLDAYVSTRGPLEPTQAVVFINQVASAMAAAHAAGIIHRDLKPSNIFVTHPPEHNLLLKVLDFGIAKVEMVDSDVALSRTGMVIGTAGYMAPEVVGGQPATPASDVYALGMVLYFMLTGAPAFCGPNQAAVMRAQLLAPPPSLQTRSPNAISDELEQLIEACLQKDPALRPATGRHLVARLTDLPEARAGALVAP